MEKNTSAHGSGSEAKQNISLSHRNAGKKLGEKKEGWGGGQLCGPKIIALVNYCELFHDCT